MTSPLETNNVVERLVVARDTLAGHLMHNEANYVTLGIQVIQSLSDRIDELEGALKPFIVDYRHAGVPNSVPDDARWAEVDFDNTRLLVGDFRRASLTQGGK